MKLILQGTDRRYDIESLCPLFFPGEGFSEEQGKILTVTRNGNCFRATFQIEQTVTEAEVHVQPGLYDGERAALKRAVYEALQKAIGISSPWGILSGVRPLHFYQSALSCHGTQTEEILEREYLISPEKEELCRDTARQQIRAKILNVPDSAGLYLSIPFCPSRCRYCSFVSELTQREKNLIPAYLKKMKLEMTRKAPLLQKSGQTLRTVYIGGGTPTVLTSQELGELLTEIRQHFDLSQVLEYTVEAGRPDTMTEEKLQVLKKKGVTRVSVNPQTLSDEVLCRIGRNHTVEDFFQAYQTAKAVGLEINVDLIAGLPGEDADAFSAGFREILSLAPENITLHTLYIKRAAAFDMEDTAAAFTKQGDQAGKMVEFARKQCREAGYFPYYLYRQKNTVGNHENVGYTRPGKESLYNIYMMDDLQPIWGIGANAVSKIISNEGRVYRTYNTKFAYNYLKEDLKC